MIYSPAPGSTTERAVAHLRSLPPGTELSTAALAEAIDATPNNLSPCLQPAADHGWLAKRQKGGHPKSPSFWSLAPAAIHAHEAARSVLGWKARADQTPINGNLAGEAVAPSQAPQTIVAAKHTPLPLRFALWSDGALELRRGSALALLLTDDETRELVAYLDRLALRSDDIEGFAQ